MIIGGSDLRVVLVTGPIDFRAGVNKLASLVAHELGRDPYSSDIFIFRSKRMDVTVRLLPRRLGLEAGGELGIIDEVIEEAVPGLGGAACISEHVAQFFYAVVG